MNKSELRAYIRRQFRLTTDADRQRWSEEVCHRIEAYGKVKEARYVMAFYPLGDEVNILPLLNALHKEGKTVLLPVANDDCGMTLRVYGNNSNMEQGILGTSHPQGEDFSDYDKIDVALIPGQAFDKEGHRLGRGKGYYDRFLKTLNRAYTMAVCFPYQIVDSVPFEPHDITIDHV